MIDVHSNYSFDAKNSYEIIRCISHLLSISFDAKKLHIPLSSKKTAYIFTSVIYLLLLFQYYHFQISATTHKKSTKSEACARQHGSKFWQNFTNLGNFEGGRKKNIKFLSTLIHMLYCKYILLPSQNKWPFIHESRQMLVQIHS